MHERSDNCVAEALVMECNDSPLNHLLLYPRDHAFADPAASAGMGLEPREHGMLLCLDYRGVRWTVVGDAEYLRTLLVAPRAVRLDLAIPGSKFPIRRSGWPADWRST